MDGLDALPDVTLKLCLAVVLSGILGLERERKGRAVGLRTMVLVCLGSTLLISVGDLFAKEWTLDGPPVWMDKARIAAGIITGIGFLGAGTIITIGSVQRGLTTAAMVWFVAALGITIGEGYFRIAGVATAIAFGVVYVLEGLEKIMPIAETFTLTVRVADGLDKIGQIESLLRADGCKVRAGRIRTAHDSGVDELTFEIKSAHRGIEKLAKSVSHHIENAESIVIDRYNIPS